MPYNYSTPRSSRTAATEGFFRTRSSSDFTQTSSQAVPKENSASKNRSPEESARAHHPHATSLSSPRRGDGLKSFKAMQKSNPNETPPKPPNFLMDPKSRGENTTSSTPPLSSSVKMRNFPQGSRRSFSARSMTMTDAALAAIAFDDEKEESKEGITEASAVRLKKNALICTMCFNGMDVVFATTSKNTIMGIFARTRVPFQYLDLPLPSEHSGVTIVSLVGNSITGIVLATLSNGDIYTYIPREAPVLGEIYNHYNNKTPQHDNYLSFNDQNGHEMNQIPPSAFGRYRWCSEQVIHCSRFFDLYSNTNSNLNQGQPKLEFMRKRNRKEGEVIAGENDDSRDNNNSTDEVNFYEDDDYKSYVHVSCCRMNKILVAYRDQMAVFQISVAATVHAGAAAQILTEAELLWITQVHQQILHAQLSGDGNAIAVVVEGEGEGVPFPFGVRTFLRDQEDGSFISSKRRRSIDGRTSQIPPISQVESFDSTDTPNQINRKHKSPTLAVGVIYKSGPFLSHSQPVTRISWRGGGSSAHSTDDAIATDGNDLLLTHCKEDSSTRVFSQGGMKQLMQWYTPPGSRADWIHGISAANLGDLDSSKKDRDAADEDDMWSKDRVSRVTSSGFLNTLEENGSSSPAHHILPHHPVPSTSAGAWIAELTFRGAYPALRLSRLTFVKKGGDNYHAAHFESVAAILPAGALVPTAIFEGEEESFSVQGFWPIWNPWTRGSGTGVGGSHSPPSELRIVASHATEDRATILEFPLWGDKDFGAMEFGSPLKYVLVLSDLEAQDEPNDNFISEFPNCLEFESSRLVAQITPDKQAVDLTWHREGSMSILPFSQSSNGSTPSFQGSPHTSSLQPILENDKMKKYIDVSITPLPLDLPPVRNQCNQGDITHLGWWPDENFGGPPRLLLLNSNGTIILFEMPPPWSALEPPMPVSFESIDKSVTSETEIYGHSVPMDDDTLGSHLIEERQEYEVSIKPHPDFGIGLRLEAQADGLPAIAGSYKKHPLTGGRLPAEKSGMIVLGDELLSVNNVGLEGVTFDDIINIVRKIGASSKDKLWLKFRPPTNGENSFRESFDGDSSLGHNDWSNGSTESFKRQRKKILNLAAGISPSRGDVDSVKDGSVATMMVGAEGEIQQEFCRIIGRANCAIPGDVTAMQLLPWHYGAGAPNPDTISGAALIVTCSGRTLTASRLEVSRDLNPENSRHYIMGSVELKEKVSEKQAHIQSLTYVKTANAGWCLAACDNFGMVTLVFVDVEDKGTNNESKEEKKEDSPFRATFRQCSIFEPSKFSSNFNQASYILRAYSVQLLATVPKSKSCSKVTVWLALPRSHISTSEDNQLGYRSIIVSIDPKDSILDFRWLPSGYLDAFPWLVTFSRRSVIVHQRPGSELDWVGVAELTYPSIMGCSPHLNKINFVHDCDHCPLYVGILSPADAYPHMIPALRDIVECCDERKHLRSDWHPDSILASICTEADGANVALKRNVRGLFTWLSQWMSPDVASRPQWNAHYNLEIAPLRVVQDDSVFEEDNEYEEEEITNTAASLFTSLSIGKPQNQKDQSYLPTEAELLMFELQTALRVQQQRLGEIQKTKGIKKPKRSKEFLLAMSQSKSKEKKSESGEIPAPLKNLNEDEILFLWAMGELIVKPPKFSKLDASSQLTLFSLTLLRTLESYGVEKEDNGDSTCETNRTYRKTESFATSFQHGLVSPPGIASGACLAALFSNTQNKLLSTIRIPDMKMNWEIARAIRLPFWMRDDEELKAIAEEIGQQIFKTTKNVMECALFYVAIGKNLKLQTMARADRNDSGQKLFKFLSNFDFSSERGRTAAEKNAYSLLRKRQYGVAAAFFLLPEPPMLKTALEVIVTQMEDLTLAFFVARLVEHARTGTSGNFSDNLTLKRGGLQGFGNPGGFIKGSASKIEEPYEKWTPTLGSGARNMLEERGIALSKHDPCFEAMLLLWLNKPIHAARCLAGSTKNVKGNEEYNIDVIVPPTFSLEDMKTINVPCLSPPLNQSTACFERVIIKSNLLISFCSAPFLLRSMKSDKRLLWSSTLHVSRALSRRGLELSSVQTLLKYTDASDYDEKEDPKSSCPSTNGVKPMQSSIFDSFDTAPPKQAPTHGPSIFDSYDTAPSKPKPEQSSIFDSFDAAPPKPKPVQSSIFDTFDTAPPKPKPVQSSIFDSYDTAPQKPKPVQSSIFDSFDTAPQKPKPVQSSIFDSFDVPTRPPRNKDQIQGEMKSSIFDSYDTAPAKPKSTPNVSTQTAGMSSSIFDSYSSSPSKSSVSSISKSNDTKKILKVESEENTLPLPILWLEWREYTLAKSVARRLIREMARVVAKFHGDPISTPIQVVKKNSFPLAPTFATEVFQSHCEGDLLLSSVQECLDELCSTCHLEAAAVVEQALLLLGCPGLPRRIVFAVLLHRLMNRDDLAEDVVRDAAHCQMRSCESFAFSNDDLVNEKKTLFHQSGLFVRRKAARISWQLELCLWLHRGGVLPLTGIAVKETVIAVRIGFLVASWGRCHDTLESLMKCNPDCAHDPEHGRQLWTSMKIMDYESDNSRKSNNRGSGGWEFLVDCRRDEATNLLRDRRAGSFLLRPHPEDHGVFTLSFKTNLLPSTESETEANNDGSASKTKSRPVSPDDVVQHAIIRLSDSGFRCGSFGPFPSLMKLLEEVSSSLPFTLLFDEPPAQGIIKDQGSQPSPNAFLLRKLALNSSSEYVQLKKLESDSEEDFSNSVNFDTVSEVNESEGTEVKDSANDESEFLLKKQFGLFAQLLVLSELRKQLSAIAIADFDDPPDIEPSWQYKSSSKDKQTNDAPSVEPPPDPPSHDEYGFIEEDMLGVASRMLRPFLQWCQTVETMIVPEIAPCQIDSIQTASSLPVDVDVSETGIEAAVPGSPLDGGDALIRRMIQPGSGVTFRTLRVGEGGNSAVIVLFSKAEAISWLVSSGSEKTTNEAVGRLKRMEKRRVIEEINLDHLLPNNHGKHFPLVTSTSSHGLKRELCYRFIDPWEVEILERREDEGKGASLGRERLLSFNLGSVARSCEKIQRSLGGVRLLSLWSFAKGGIFLTKAIASMHPPWDRDVGTDLQVSNGSVVEPSPFLLSLKKRLYRNAMFRRLRVPQRFVSLVQIELLDLKNLTAPGGSPPLNAFALLRLKRAGSSAPLNLKARTLDSACTRPKKIARSSGPNAPASWGTLVRFRFSLPEDVSCDCVSYDSDREALFKGPPCVLQMSVYEKKFMSDLLLGDANVKLDALNSGGQLEEWVPLRSTKEGINWFARIRMTLRFELMCLDTEEQMSNDSTNVELELDDKCPSVGLSRIRQLSREGGTHEVSKGVKRSVSTPDFKGYFDSMTSF